MSARLMVQPAPDRPELEALITASIANFAALSPAQQASHRAAQALSFVLSAFALDPSDPREDRERTHLIVNEFIACLDSDEEIRQHHLAIVDKMRIMDELDKQSFRARLIEIKDRISHDFD